jgi:type I restriction enzyme M protein
LAIKKSELYSSLWQSCDQLRGGMDASQYKDYVLVLLFVKYVSDRYAGKKEALIEVPPGGSFADMVALKGDKEIGEKIDTIIDRLAEANELEGVINVATFNDEDKLGRGKEMVDRLSNLVSIFDTPALDFRDNRTEGDDLLGDAYEYLMIHFATESGKSKGQFYTPAEVSRIMARVIGIDAATSTNQTIYDPTCGSGSLLLKAHDEARRHTHMDLAIYGQEMDNATAALAKMNMILHECPRAEIWQDNTLSSPYFKQEGSLKTFDFAVANPPFSTKAWSNGFDPGHDEYERFEYGTPPDKNGDYAFLLHLLTSLKTTGKGAIILPHGVLFRGNVEATIRREIVRRGFIKGIIGLPANLFYGTGIPACIIVLDKERAAARKGLFMIDASKGFIKDGNKNRLRAQDIHRIVDTFNRQLEVEKYARMVPLEEIAGHDFNLNIPRYIDSSDEEDIQDIEAHLKGGMPDRDIQALDRYWQVFPGIRGSLFAPERTGYSQLRVESGEIKSTIFDHPEFAAFHQSASARFEQWQTAHIPSLKDIQIGDRPKELIEVLSEDLLGTFKKVDLLDPYDVYQHLMDYWEAEMQDDVYMLVSDGWQGMVEGKPNTDLIPTALIVHRFFQAEAQAIEQLEEERDAIGRQMEELEEEHGGEEGLLVEAQTDKGKLTKASIRARLTEIKKDPEADEERELLEGYLELIDQQATGNKKVKAAQKELTAKVAARYGKLTEEEIQSLVVDDKWMAVLTEDIQGELDRVSQALTGRIQELAERYAKPLPEFSDEVQILAGRVEEHLKRMGVVWS